MFVLSVGLAAYSTSVLQMPAAMVVFIAMGELFALTASLNGRTADLISGPTS
jgi:hypothetical protein